jgi:hypothetical protein
MTPEKFGVTFGKLLLGLSALTTFIAAMLCLWDMEWERAQAFLLVLIWLKLCNMREFMERKS